MSHALTSRPIMQKQPRIEMPKLRNSAKDAPWCFACHAANRGGNLVLAHDNWLDGGKGLGVKTHDVLGAIVCGEPGGCHDHIDGRVGNLPKEERREMHYKAHKETLAWWVRTGLLK